MRRTPTSLEGTRRLNVASPLACILAVAIVVAAGATHDVAQGTEARSGMERCQAPLRNLQVANTLEPIVHEMWHRSPTFRRQVRRLTREPELVVTIAIWRFESSSAVRATTRFTRVHGLLTRAQVQVKKANVVTLVELIAHELEHVLEQLDGVNLVYSARGKGATARLDEGDGWFETERARQVGLAVAAEYEAGPVDEGRCDGAPR
jgi:hypothetical protein